MMRKSDVQPIYFFDRLVKTNWTELKKIFQPEHPAQESEGKGFLSALTCMKREDV